MLKCLQDMEVKWTEKQKVLKQKKFRDKLQKKHKQNTSLINLSPNAKNMKDLSHL